MKKHILLTTTAMLLSAITLKANADSNSAQLEIHASFGAPFEITEEQYLGFGAILANGPNKTVVVTPDGKLDPASTATVMSTAAFQNYYDDGFDIAIGSFNEALFNIKGTLPFPDKLSDEEANLVYSVNFADTRIDMMDTTNKGIKCGTVSDFTTNFEHYELETFLLHVGGTFTTADLSESELCVGKTTLTIVINEDFWSY